MKYQRTEGVVQQGRSRASLLHRRVLPPLRRFSPCRCRRRFFLLHGKPRLPLHQRGIGLGFLLRGPCNYSRGLFFLKGDLVLTLDDLRLLPDGLRVAVHLRRRKPCLLLFRFPGFRFRLCLRLCGLFLGDGQFVLRLDHPRYAVVVCGDLLGGLFKSRIVDLYMDRGLVQRVHILLDFQKPARYALVVAVADVYSDADDLGHFYTTR